MQKLERHQWEENNWEKPELAWNIAGIVDTSFISGVKLSSQRLGFEQMSGNAKKPGIADPRFKRAVPNALTEEIANEARKLSETFAKSAIRKEEYKTLGTESTSNNKSSRIPMGFVKKSSFKLTENPPKLTPPVPEKANDKAEEINLSKKTQKQNEEIKENNCDNCPQPDNSTKGDKENLKEAGNQVNIPKKSISDCTVQTKKTSLGEEDGAEDYNKVQSFTSATGLSKVDKWIKDLKPNPEKRRSVITVIGQIQGKSFSALLNEINQRRKLAKELDKHALCEAILPSPEKGKERKNLLAKDITSFGEKTVCSAKKIDGVANSGPFYEFKTNKCEDFPFNNRESLNIGQMSFKLNDQIPERDVPVIQARKRKTKRLTRKSICRKFDFGGVNNMLLYCMEKQKLMSAIVLFFTVVFAILVLSFNKSQIFDYLHLGKPKRKPWYEAVFE